MFEWLRKKSVDDLVSDLLAPGYDEKTSLKAYKAALRLGEKRDPKTIPSLTTAMLGSSRSIMIGNSVKYVGVAAAQALAAIGTDDALQSLKQSFRSGNHGAREVAASALKRRGIAVPNPNASWKKVFVTVKNEVYDTTLKIPDEHLVVAFAIDAASDGYLRIIEFEVTNTSGQSATLTRAQAKALEQFFVNSSDYIHQWSRMPAEVRQRILGNGAK